MRRGPVFIKTRVTDTSSAGDSILVLYDEITKQPPRLSHLHVG